MIQFLLNDDMQKCTRLCSALQYVEHPEDTDIVNSLKENIDINVENAKWRGQEEAQ